MIKVKRVTTPQWGAGQRTGNGHCTVFFGLLRFERTDSTLPQAVPGSGLLASEGDDGSGNHHLTGGQLAFIF